MKAYFVLIAFMLTACPSGKHTTWTELARQKHPWGYYSGAVEARWDSDGRTMTLLSELRYVDPNGNVWVAPPGSVVDGASIPRALWSIMGGPFEGKYRNASVLHDISYDQHNRPWSECDRMFYNAMRCSGVGPIEAKTIYYSLYRFGRHWKFAVKRAKPVKVGGEMIARAEEVSGTAPVNATQVNEVRDWIRNANPSLDQIDQRAESEAR